MRERKHLYWRPSCEFVVLLQYQAPSGAASGITRYSLRLADALELVGETVRRWPLRRLELRIGDRGFGGLASLRLQMAVPRRKRGDLLHSTHLYTAHARADVVTVHDCFPEVYRAELGRTAIEDRIFAANLQAYVARGTEFLIDSEATRAAFLRLHPEVAPSRTHVVHLGIEPSFAPAPDGAKPHPAYRDDALNLLCVADLNPRKRVDWLLEAVAGLDRPVRLVHVGSRAVARPAWAAQLQREEPWGPRLGDRLVRLGAVGDEELLRLYQGADLLVLPSLDEGFGFPPLEAMRCGTPVLLTDRPIFRETFGERAGYFTGVESLRKALAHAHARPTAAQRRSNSAWVAATYTWERTAAATRAVYEQARGAGRPRRA